jgi:hypothetical protein
VDDVYQNWQKASKVNKKKMSDHLLRLLRLLDVWVNFRGGKIVADPDNVAQVRPIFSEQIIALLFISHKI